MDNSTTMCRMWDNISLIPEIQRTRLSWTNGTIGDFKSWGKFQIFSTPFWYQ